MGYVTIGRVNWLEYLLVSLELVRKTQLDSMRLICILCILKVRMFVSPYFV